MEKSMQDVETGGTDHHPWGYPNLYSQGVVGTGAGSLANKRRNQRGDKAPRAISKKSEVMHLAKDGTVRGGQRTGSGRKPKALADKIAAGNPGGRKLTVVDFSDTADLSGVEMPEPSEYLKETQKDGEEFEAAAIYKKTWLWLKERGCEKLISQEQLEQYAVAVSRWIQCERAITQYGLLAKHPTTGAACSCPYISISQQYQKQASAIWYSIFQVVKENCSSEYTGASPQEDIMEQLLRTGRKRNG